MQRSVLYGKHDSEAGCHGFAVHEGLVLGSRNQKSGAMRILIEGPVTPTESAFQVR
jgi:hypothetical protein